MTTDRDWLLTREKQHYETIGMAAQRLGYTQTTLKRTFQRLGVTPDDHLDARTPVYLVTGVDEIMAARPGKGSPGRPRPHRRVTRR